VRLLDAGLELALRRPWSLLLCGVLGWGPVYLVGLLFASLVTTEVTAVALELALLGLGTLASVVWLGLCWSHAAALSICAAEARRERLELGTAFRRALGLVPRAALAGATRLLVTALSLFTLGVALPAARVLTAGLGAVAVLDEGRLAEGFELSSRAAGAFALAHLALWSGAVLVFGNLVLTWIVASPFLGEAAAGVLEALEAGNAVLLLAGLATLVVLEPFRAGVITAVWHRASAERAGSDLAKRLARLATVFALLLPFRAQAETSEDWATAVGEARQAVVDELPAASGRIALLEGMEVDVGPRTARVTDPVLTVLAEGVQLGDATARHEAVRHLAALEREAHALSMAPPLPEELDAPLVATRGSQGDNRPAIRLARGRLQAWVAALRGGSGGPVALVAGAAVIGATGLALVVLMRGEIAPRPTRLRPPEAPMAAELRPDGTLRFAVRSRFLAVLKALSARGLVARPGQLTNGQIGRALPPRIAERFWPAARAYERTWYGHGVAREVDLEAVEQALDAVREPG